MLFFGGCAEVPIAPAEMAYPNVRLAARNVAHELAKQIRHAGGGGGAIWVSPVINRHSGEITASGREMQVLLALDLKTLLGDAVVQSLGGNEAAQWNWVLVPSVQFEKPQQDKLDESWFKVDIAVVSPQGKNLNGISLRVNSRQFDATPSRFFRDAPLFLTGDYQHTRQEFSRGDQSAVPRQVRNRFIAIEALLQEAILSYESGDFRQALAGFSQVLERDVGNLSALSGRYQALLEMGEQAEAEAEAALERMMVAALEQNNISFRFLFQVRSVEFRDDLSITRRYHSWLKQLAKQLYSSGRCLKVVGHASRSGTFEYNQQLSSSRANQVMGLLLKHATGLKGRIKAEGRSYQDNIVGSGSDDATDAIDRRVDFTLTAC